jgi:hypothetical protein
MGIAEGALMYSGGANQQGIVNMAAAYHQPETGRCQWNYEPDHTSIKVGCELAWDEYMKSVSEYEDRAHLEHPDWGLTVMAECHMTQAVAQAYLDKRGSKGRSKLYTIDDVKMDETRLNSAEREEFLEVIRQHPAVLVKCSEDLPLPFKGRHGKEVIHNFQFKKDARPTTCRCPKFPPESAKTKLMEEITEANIKSYFFLTTSASSLDVRKVEYKQWLHFLRNMPRTYMQEQV